MTQRCKTCHGTIAGIKRGNTWLARAVAVHDQTCPGRPDTPSASH